MIELKVGEEIRIRCIEDFTRIPECTKCCFYQQCNAIVTHCQSFSHKDDIARPGEMMADMGIVEENNIKMLDV